jgi:hypothetical protein
MPESKPVLVHDDCIYWPNGEGYTECTTAYRMAVERNETNPDDYTYVALMEQGHMGERVRLDKPDPLIALLGGASVSPAGDGTWRVEGFPEQRLTIKDPDAVLTAARDQGDDS